jgi:hypothetical protein
MKIELPVKRNTAYHSVFSCVRNITIVPNSSFQVNGTSTVSLARKASMFEAGRPRALFSSGN